MNHSTDNTPHETPVAWRGLGRWAIVAALVGVVGLGVWLRAVLAGWAVLPGPFAQWRHAHSHLGYYGVLFPVMWAWWAAARGWAPGPRLALVYGLSVVVSAVGFARAGYGPEAIGGSTVVLGVWLAGAWGMRRFARSRHEGLGGVSVAIVLGALCVPPIAALTRRDPEVALGVVRSFLSVLALGALAPSALQALGAPVGRSGAWAALATLAALRLGVLPAWWLSWAPMALAVWLVTITRRAAVPGDVRLAWWAVAFGLGVIVMPWRGGHHHLSVAGLHLLVLGPLLLSALVSLAPRPPALVWRAAYLVALLVMSATIAAQDVWPQPWLPGAATLTGALVALGAVALAAWAARSAHQQPT